MHQFYPPVSPAWRELPRPLVTLISQYPMPCPPRTAEKKRPSPLSLILADQSQPGSDGSVPTDSPSAVACASNQVGSQQPWGWGSFSLLLGEREEGGLGQAARQSCCSRYPGKEWVFIGTDREDLGKAQGSWRVSSQRRGTEIAEA